MFDKHNKHDWYHGNRTTTNRASYDKVSYDFQETRAFPNASKLQGNPSRTPLQSPHQQEFLALDRNRAAKLSMLSDPQQEYREQDAMDAKNYFSQPVIHNQIIQK